MKTNEIVVRPWQFIAAIFSVGFVFGYAVGRLQP